MEYYWIHANVFRDERLEVGARPYEHFEGYTANTTGAIRYIDSSLFFEPYFSRHGDLKLIRNNGIFEDKYYSLEGVDAWTTSAPLHIYIRYQIDSSGFIITRERELTLQKYSNCFFSVH